jgi:hypothetical protein
MLIAFPRITDYTNAPLCYILHTWPVMTSVSFIPQDLNFAMFSKNILATLSHSAMYYGKETKACTTAFSALPDQTL